MNKIVLATLVLNEMEWLPRLYEQHKNWPGMTDWIFVEAADAVYANSNPDRVSPMGLSVDGTTDFLRELREKDSRVKYIPYGITSHLDPAQGKVPARQAYIDLIPDLKKRPDYLMVVDADEFYTRRHQDIISRMYIPGRLIGCVFPQRHIWKPEASTEPLFSQEVVGAYWSIPHCRMWRYTLGMSYNRGNHNTPFSAKDGRCLRMDSNTRNRNGTIPECIHLGFASSLINRAAKHRYYIDRGEGKVDKRSMYVDCRRAFEEWSPGTILPHKARVIKYTGEVPEVFNEREAADIRKEFLGEPINGGEG